MKKIIGILGLFIFLLQNIELTAQTRCFSDERRTLFQSQKFSQLQISHPNLLQNREVVTIPVVVHVVWNEAAENLSDEQIISQIDVLNEDFRALNEEVSGVPSEFASVLADVEIEFCLAKVDPNGNPTDGIDREFTNQPVFSAVQNRIFYEAEGGADAWGNGDYLNIWVCDLGGNIAGFASFPGDAPPAEDGVVVHYENFGRVAVEPPYHLGRTTTHEVGHFFNIEHVWTNCGDDDGVADTPMSSASYLQECPAHPEVSCGTNDMFMNFMYYTDDACMAMFSEGQKEVMLATLNGFRASLKTSTACEPVSTIDKELDKNLTIFPNPVDDKLFLSYDELIYNNLKISIINNTGISLKEFSKVKSIDFSNFESGIYYLKIESEKGIVMRKIIKI